MGRGVYKNYYKGHMDNQGGGWRWEREVGLAGVGRKYRQLQLNNNKKKEVAIKIKT